LLFYYYYYYYYFYYYYYGRIIILLPRMAELYDRSFVLSVSRITRERGNGRRPNMVGMGKG